MALAVTESAAARHTRDVVSQSADRKTRAYGSQPDERLHRLYVAPNGTSAFDV